MLIKTWRLCFGLVWFDLLVLHLIREGCEKKVFKVKVFQQQLQEYFNSGEPLNNYKMKQASKIKLTDKLEQEKY